jgi:hypothetical protein
MMIILFLAASSTTVLYKLHLTDRLLLLPSLNIYVCVHYVRADEKIFPMQRVVLTCWRLELQRQGVMLQH